MKRILVFAFLLISLTGTSQIKITELPTHTGDPAGAWVPIVIGGVNKKVNATNFLLTAVRTTGSYTNPSWLVSIPWTKITGTPTTLSAYGITDPVVLTSGSYANPSWITALAWSKITGTPTTLSGYGITDPIVLTSGSYANPAWITSLAWSKITGTPTTAAGYGLTDVFKQSGNAFGATATFGTTDANHLDFIAANNRAGRVFQSTRNWIFGSSTTDLGYKVYIDGTLGVNGAATFLAGITATASGANFNFNSSGTMTFPLGGTAANDGYGGTGLTIRRLNISGSGAIVITSTSGGGQGDASAVYETRANGDRGALPAPVLTSAQRSAISSPMTGLQVFQSDGTAGQYIKLSAAWARFLTSVDGATYVPYTGATTNVNLGSNSLTGGSLYATSGSNSVQASPTALSYSVGANQMILSPETLTATRAQYLQDADGVIALRLSGTVTWDAPNTAAGQTTSTTFTVTGAAIGDVVAIGLPDIGSIDDVIVSARVSATNTVKLTIYNASSTDIDFASAAYKIKVIR
jgi:hypothetical protein